MEGNAAEPMQGGIEHGHRCTNADNVGIELFQSGGVHVPPAEQQRRGRERRQSVVPAMAHTSDWWKRLNKSVIRFNTRLTLPVWIGQRHRSGDELS